MKRDGKSATGKFGVAGHALPDPDPAFDFCRIIVQSCGPPYEEVIIVNPDLDRIINDHFFWDTAVSDYHISKIAQLHRKTEACRTSRHFYQSRGLVRFFSGVSDAAQQ